MGVGTGPHPANLSRPTFQVRRRRYAGPRLVMVLAVLLASVGILASIAVSIGRQGPTAYAKPSPPADVFMESIVTDDGSLGWQQLCPSTRTQIPENALVKQANAERSARAQQGLKLTMDFIGARPRPGGGELRVYIVTGHWPNGTMDMRTYSVLTQSSGCVENVNAQ